MSMIADRPIASPVNVTGIDPVAAVYALQAVELERDYWAQRIGILARIRGPLEPDATEEELAIKVAKLDEVARKMRAAMYGDDELAAGDHFAYPTHRRTPGIYAHRAAAGKERPLPLHDTSLHVAAGTLIPPPYLVDCPRCQLEGQANGTLEAS